MKTMGPKFAKKKPEMAAKVNVDGSASVACRRHTRLSLLLQDAICGLSTDEIAARKGAAELEDAAAAETDPEAKEALLQRARDLCNAARRYYDRMTEYLELQTAMGNQEWSHREKGYRAFQA
jgi:hypothetical protein